MRSVRRRQRCVRQESNARKSHSPDEARLIIGDPAIAFRKTASPNWHFLDLGEAWYRFTGLPFVFAVWVVRRDHPERNAITQTLQESLQMGQKHLEIIAAEEADPDFALKYLTHSIRYEFGEEQKQAMAQFREWLDKLSR